MDATYPFLTVEQGETLRASVMDSFGAHGVSVRAFGDHVRAADGTEYPLGEMAALCHRTDEQAWREVVDAVVARTLTPGADVVGALSVEEARARVVARLARQDDPAIVGLPNRPVADGVVELLAIDGSDSLQLLDAATVEKLSVDAFDLGGVARANLAALELASPVSLGEGEQAFHAIVDASVHVGSKALVLDSVLAAHAQTADERGVLLVAPHRHALAWHVISSRAALAALNDLVGFARSQFVGATHPLSADLFWWHDGALTRVVEVDAVSGKARPCLGTPFDDVLRGL